MLDRFYMDIASTQDAKLAKYCKIENVSLAVLFWVDKPKSTLKHRLQSTAFHLLQRVNKRLNVLIDRLSAEVEYNGSVQRRLS